METQFLEPKTVPELQSRRDELVYGLHNGFPVELREIQDIDRLIKEKNAKLAKASA